jgi:hypothetical protein
MKLEVYPSIFHQMKNAKDQHNMACLPSPNIKVGFTSLLELFLIRNKLAY